MKPSLDELKRKYAELGAEIAKLEAEPSVPTTIEAVYNEVEPVYTTLIRQVPSYANSKQVNAFGQLLTLVDCLDSHFGEGDVHLVWYVDRDYDFRNCQIEWLSKPLITFKTRKAAQHAIEHFRPLFERYYGVTL